MDIPIFYWINRWPHFVRLNQGLSYLDSFFINHQAIWLFAILFLYGIITRKKSLWMGALFLFLALILCEILVLQLKLYFHRPRPYETLRNVYALNRSKGPGFPAQVPASVALTGIFMILATNRWKLFWIGLILLMGVFRVYIGAHYPSDVLAGWLIGAFLAYPVYRGYNVLKDMPLSIFSSKRKKRASGAP